LKAFTNHPETQAKLRDHIRQAIPDKQLGEFSMEDLTSEKTPYLEAVVYEALRYGQLSIAFGRLGN
jgi:cytochrome P450